jgi:fatty acid-binding protein DegV
LVTEDEYKSKFNEYLDKGMDVLYIGCSSALSGSVKLGAKVAKQIME